jgi:PBP1b-binding outer membrane lipoprotein LpoB
MKRTALRLASITLVALTAFSLSGCIAKPDPVDDRNPSRDTTTVPDDPTTQATQDGIESLLQLAAREANNEMPQMVDEITQLDSLEAPGNRVMRYNYTLLTFSDGQLNAEQIAAFKDVMTPELIAAVVEKPGFAAFKASDVIFEHHYYTSDGVELFVVQVTPEDYK